MQKLSLKDIYLDESYYSGSQSEPVTLAEIKSHLLIETAFTDDDTYLTSLGTYARNKLETYCSISIQNKLATATLTANSNAGPYRKDWDRGFFGQDGIYGDTWFELPYGPVKNIQSVTGISDTTITSLSLNTDYFTQGTNFKQIRFASLYPTLMVVYQVGWPTIPLALKEAILNEVAFRYENRGDNTNRYAQQNVGLCEAAEYLAKDFIRVWL